MDWHPLPNAIQCLRYNPIMVFGMTDEIIIIAHCERLLGSTWCWNITYHRTIRYQDAVQVFENTSDNVALFVKCIPRLDSMAVASFSILVAIGIALGMD